MPLPISPHLYVSSLSSTLSYHFIISEDQYIITSEARQMGCSSSTQDIYEVKEIEYSNRDINENSSQFLRTLDELPNTACGYEFELHPKEEDFTQESEKQNKQREHKAKWELFQQLCVAFQKSIEESTIDKCNELRKQIIDLSKEVDLEVFESVPLEKRENLLKKLEHIEQEHLQLTCLESQLQSSGWEETKEQQFSLKFRQQNNRRQVVITAQISLSLDLLAASFSSLQKASEIIKFALSSKLLRKLTPFKQIGEIVLDCPFSQKIQNYYQLSIYDRLAHNNSVFISYRSLYQNEKLCERIDFYPAYQCEHRIDFAEISCKLEDREGQVEVTLYFDMQIQLQSIADWVISKLCRNIALSTLQKLIEKAGSSSEKAATDFLQNDHQIYQYFNTVLKQRKEKQA